jgi:hypothetical protein
MTYESIVTSHGGSGTEELETTSSGGHMTISTATTTLPDGTVIYLTTDTLPNGQSETISKSYVVTSSGTATDIVEISTGGG